MKLTIETYSDGVSLKSDGIETYYPNSRLDDAIDDLLNVIGMLRRRQERGG